MVDPMRIAVAVVATAVCLLLVACQPGRSYCYRCTVVKAGFGEYSTWSGRADSLGEAQAMCSDAYEDPAFTCYFCKQDDCD